MFDVSEWALVGLTGVLSGATIALAYHTFRLGKITKQVSEAAEASKIATYLAFNATPPLSDGAGKYLRYSVKNIGSGHARRPGARAFVKNGRELEVKPHSEMHVIESGKLF